MSVCFVLYNIGYYMHDVPDPLLVQLVPLMTALINLLPEVSVWAGFVYPAHPRPLYLPRASVRAQS